MADNQGDQVPPPPTSNTTSSGKYTLEKVKEAEKYSGSAIERPRKFFQKYELAAQADGWNEETKAAKLPIFLTGEALIFYRSETTQEEKANYATVRRKIEDKFNRPDLNRVRVNLFNALKKNTAETVEEWAGRVRESAEEAFEDANLATDMAVATFCKELPDEQLRNHLVMKDPPVATLNEALAIARRFKELCRRDVETLNVAAAKLSFRDDNNDDSFRRIRSASRERLEYDREYHKNTDNRRSGEYRQDRQDYRDKSPDNNRSYRDRDQSRRYDWQDYRSREDNRSFDRGGKDRGNDYRDRNNSRDRRDTCDNRDRWNNYTRSDPRENWRDYRDSNDSRDRREDRDYNDQDRRQRGESGDCDNRNFRNNRDAKDQTRCYACNNYGHISYECPGKRDKGGPAVGSCRVGSATIRDPYEDINNELRRLEGQPHCGAFHVTKRCKIHREPSPENMEDIGYDYDYIVCPSCHVGTGDSFEGSIIHCNSCEAYFCGMCQWEAYATQETAPQVPPTTTTPPPQPQVPPPGTFPAEEPRTRQSDSTNKRSSEVTKEMSSQVATEYKKPEETTRDEDQHQKKTEKRKAPTKADNASDDAKEADSTSMDFDDQDKNPETLPPKEEALPILKTPTKPSTEEATEPEDKIFSPAETEEATETEDTGGDPTVPTDTAFLTSWDPDKDRNRVRKSLKTLIRSSEYQVDYNEAKELKKRFKKLKQELTTTKETVSTLKKEKAEKEEIRQLREESRKIKEENRQLREKMESIQRAFVELETLVEQQNTPKETTNHRNQPPKITQQPRNVSEPGTARNRHNQQPEDTQQPKGVTEKARNCHNQSPKQNQQLKKPQGSSQRTSGAKIPNFFAIAVMCTLLSSKLPYLNASSIHQNLHGNLLPVVGLLRNEARQRQRLEERRNRLIQFTGAQLTTNPECFTKFISTTTAAARAKEAKEAEKQAKSWVSGMLTAPAQLVLHLLTILAFIAGTGLLIYLAFKQGWLLKVWRLTQGWNRRRPPRRQPPRRSPPATTTNPKAETEFEMQELTEETIKKKTTPNKTETTTPKMWPRQSTTTEPKTPSKVKNCIRVNNTAYYAATVVIICIILSGLRSPQENKLLRTAHNTDAHPRKLETETMKRAAAKPVQVQKDKSRRFFELRQQRRERRDKASHSRLSDSTNRYDNGYYDDRQRPRHYQNDNYEYNPPANNEYNRPANHNYQSRANNHLNYNYHNYNYHNYHSQATRNNAYYPQDNYYYPPDNNYHPPDNTNYSQDDHYHYYQLDNNYSQQGQPSTRRRGGGRGWKGRGREGGGEGKGVTSV